MVNRKKAQQILWCETIGFVLLILLSWLNEVVALPHLLFGSGEHSSLHEALMETTALVVVWLIVISFTRRLLARLHYLEGFLHVCSWCRKINHDGQWSSVEDYFRHGFAIKTSHGMCPVCAKNWEAEVAKRAA